LVLHQMLAIAASWRPDAPVSSVDEIMGDAALAHYVAGWPGDGDVGFVVGDQPAEGAAWWTFLPEADPGYGFVDEATPELAIAVVAPSRGQGLGTLLLQALIREARERALRALSLSVEPDNPAVALYRRLGFVTVGGVGGSITMLLRIVD